jgi:protein-tyrosine-phosphatase
MCTPHPALYPDLASNVAAARTETDEIPAERAAALEQLASFIRNRISAGEIAKVTFICTHNSRRSQMAQIWAQTAAHVFAVPRVEAYSGGTEATAFDPRAIAALERAGFRFDTGATGDNPVSLVRFADELDPVECFSKVYDEPPNPRRDFLAVMTCSQADSDCPIVAGASDRIAIPYEDPKAFDGTDQEAAKYDERCRQIGREMLYLFSRVSILPGRQWG